MQQPIDTIRFIKYFPILISLLFPYNKVIRFLCILEKGDIAESVRAKRLSIIEGDWIVSYKPFLKKEEVEVNIRTVKERIEGTIHKLPQNRLLDMLNDGTAHFIPVSEAKVYCEETGKILFQADFLAVNKNHITIITDSFGPPPEV